MDPIIDNSTFMMVFWFVDFVVKAIHDLQCENWDVASDCNLHNLCSDLEFHRIGMQVHHGELQDVLPSLLLLGFPHLLLEKGLLEDDNHSWKMQSILISKLSQR